MAQLTKVCSKCKEKKLVAKFYSDKSHKDGLSTECKTCRKLRAKKRRASEQGSKLIRESKLKDKYGITLDEYDKLFEEQKGVCAICKQLETKKHVTGAIYRLSVDHNHKNGIIRGLLCKRCNIILGQFEVDSKGVELLQTAILYVRNTDG